jgi:hypothetical protein
VIISPEVAENSPTQIAYQQRHKLKSAGFANKRMKAAQISKPGGDWDFVGDIPAPWGRFA